eukprot:CAMPEP_0196582656 /NCGR_PEP_ID=MMETSP1081-20130531/39983_1 /TAXON_ID=36882 /ORGANISM="Pyramimonas amylifera, Strain CCMP720" /LENGTH=391 /DNA_ID=CAMNT_0041903287 /DNA_START=204 /DNA_END=1376 /DNA_ORIENTATION=-
MRSPTPSPSERELASLFDDELEGILREEMDCAALPTEVERVSVSPKQTLPPPSKRARFKNNELEIEYTRTEFLDSLKESVSCPPHPGYYGSMCIRCGSIKTVGPEDSAIAVPLRYVHPTLEVSKQYAQSQRQKTAHEVLENRKLFLVLDLDHTVLNSCKFSEIDQPTHDYLMKTISSQKRSGERPTLFRLERMQMFTKLRPHVFEFLDHVKDQFQLFVYTMGDKQYAHQMASLLDTTGNLFRNRIISNSDSSKQHVKDLDIMMLSGADNLVLIMDDTEQVWVKNKDNLIQVERYHYFPSSAAHFRIQGSSLVERMVDENSQFGQLASLTPILRKIHTDFFESRSVKTKVEVNTDVRVLLKEFKKSLLSGVVIVFSRVFPQDVVNPEEHPLW